MVRACTEGAWHGAVLEDLLDGDLGLFARALNRSHDLRNVVIARLELGLKTRKSILKRIAETNKNVMNTIAKNAMAIGMGGAV